MIAIAGVAACAEAAPPPGAVRIAEGTTVVVIDGPTVHEALAQVDAHRPPPPAADPEPPPPPPYEGRIPLASLRGALRRCYTASLASNPDLAGKVIVEAVVDPDGRVKSARDKGSTLPDRTVIACILSAIMCARFEPSSRTEDVTLTIPFTFVPR